MPQISRQKGKSYLPIQGYYERRGSSLNIIIIPFFLINIKLKAQFFKLSLKIDDLIVITQSSEDETWYEGTLYGRTGWFPSNYVQVLDEIIDNGVIDSVMHQIINQIQSEPFNDENIRIKVHK